MSNQEKDLDIIDENYESDLKQDQDGRKNRSVQVYGVLAGAVILFVLLIFTFYNRMSGEEEEKKKANIASVVKEKVFSLKEAKKEEIKRIVPLREEKKQFTPAPQIKRSLTPLLIKGNSKALATTKKESVNPSGSGMEGSKLAPSDFGDTLGTNPDFVGSTFSPTITKRSKFNPDLLLSKGTYIGCSLNTRLVSSIKGGISCTVSDNIYSVNGKVLLVEKGSRITGFFKSGQMNDGLNRIFVVWQEIRTPNHLVIPVFSGASDELGGSGIEGVVDHKFMLRFGSAIMLSAIDDILSILTNNINHGSGESQIDRTENTRDNAQNMASIALENFINIKPTLYKNHGELVGVYVNRDIDFSRVYKLTRATPKIYK